MNSSVLCLDSAKPFSVERRDTLERLFGRISEISTLPAAAQRIVELANDENASAVDLRDVIQTDPGLVSRILRRVNSSYYGLRNRVADLKTAINLLGFREIQNLAMTVFVSRFFDKDGTYGTYSREGLWLHSLGVALASRLVSNVCGLAKPEEAYVAGLIHDIGYILIDQHLHQHFCRIIDELNPSVTTCAVEQRLLTFDHAQLGHFVAARWNFPDRIADAIGYHHEPHRYLGPNRDLVYVVAVANYLCTAFDWPSLGVQNVSPPMELIYSKLGLDETALGIIEAELPETLEKANVLARA